MHEQLQQLMSTQARLLDSIRHLSAKLVEVAETAMDVGQQINRLSTLVDAPDDDSGESESEMPCPRDARCDLGPFHNGPCARSVNKYTGKPIARTTGEDLIGSPPASEVRPVVSHELGAEQSGPRRCNTCERKATTVRGNCASCDEIELSAAPPNLGETSPPSGVRKKNEFTAAEWVVSMHFLKYMKKAPFNSWTAEQQRETADLFVAHANKEWPSLRMNKWGERFSKFCGV